MKSQRWPTSSMHTEQARGGGKNLEFTQQNPGKGHEGSAAELS